MPQRESDPSILEVWLDHTGATLAAAAAGAVAGAAAAELFLKAGIKSAGDEAPIRVRNGTLEIKLLDDDQDFEEDNGSGPSNGKKWKFKGKLSRKHNDYVVILLPGHLDKCPKGLIAVGKKIDVEYVDGQKVHFKAPGNKTKIDAKHALEPSFIENGLLTYGAGGGYITKVTVDSDDVYERFGDDPKFQMFVLDLRL